MARFQLPHLLSRLGPRTRKVLRYAGISAFGLVVFVFALQMSLPVERAKDKLVEALSPQLDINIGSVERGFIPGRIYLKSVAVSTRPTKPEEQPVHFYIEKLRVDVGLLALVSGNLVVDADAKIGAGTLDAHVVLEGLAPLASKGIKLKVDGRDLPSDSLPAQLATNGLPMKGKIDIDGDFDIPKEKNKAGVVAFDWSKAEGSLELQCPSNCQFGDGKSKWKPIVKNHSQQALVSDGLEIEAIDVTKLDAKIEIKDAHAKVTKLDAISPDADLKFDFDMKLMPSLDDSIVTGCVRFKINDTLYKRKPKAEGAFRNTGAELRSDGYFHIKLADTWRDMKRLNAECGPNAKPDSGNTEGAPGFSPNGQRPAMPPRLTVTPEGPTPPPVPPIPPPNPQNLARPPEVVPPTMGSAGSGSGSAGSSAGSSVPQAGAIEHDHHQEAPGSGSAGSEQGSAQPGGPPNAVLQ